MKEGEEKGLSKREEEEERGMRGEKRRKENA